MALHKDWRRILREAWSMRLLYLAGLLDALEVVLPLFSDAVPRGLFVSLNLLVIPGAMVARVVAQRAFKA
mgnify:CR=1 FL=1